MDPHMPFELIPFNRYFNFAGRIGRRGYLRRLLFAMVLAWGVPWLMTDALGAKDNALAALVWIAALGAAFCLVLSATAKRPKDVGFSPVWCVLMFLPPLALAVAIGLVLLPPNNNAGRYGAPHSG
jgi:uncharacterized membrane protein YhaH (DUF805 family)